MYLPPVFNNSPVVSLSIFIYSPVCEHAETPQTMAKACVTSEVYSTDSECPEVPTRHITLNGIVLCACSPAMRNMRQ
jgi:hypothetical protein